MHTGIRYISNSGFISRDKPRNAQNPIGRKSEIPFKLKNGIDISRFLQKEVCILSFWYKLILASINYSTYPLRSILSNPETHYKLNNENYSQNNKRITLMWMHIKNISFMCSSLIHKTNELTFHALKDQTYSFLNFVRFFLLKALFTMVSIALFDRSLQGRHNQAKHINILNR